MCVFIIKSITQRSKVLLLALEQQIKRYNANRKVLGSNKILKKYIKQINKN